MKERAVDGEGELLRKKKSRVTGRLHDFLELLIHTSIKYQDVQTWTDFLIPKSAFLFNKPQTMNMLFFSGFPQELFPFLQCVGLYR